MEQTQPIIIDKNGTTRFLENELIDDFADRELNNVALYRYQFPEIHLDDFRQFNQLIGYSVGGFLSLSYCYRDGTYDSYFDEDYALYIENLEVAKQAVPPEVHIIEDEYKNYYRPNAVLVKLAETKNPEPFFNNPIYSNADKRQFAQLLGYTVDEVERRFAKES